MKEELLKLLLEFRQEAMEYAEDHGSMDLEEKVTLNHFIKWLADKE